MQATVYTIPSATTPGRSYRVSVHADGVLSCDCPDATYRRRQCKHQRQVIASAIPAERVTPDVERVNAIIAANDAAFDRASVAAILSGGW